MEAVEVTFDVAVVMIAINDAVELWREKMPGDDDGTKYKFTSKIYGAFFSQTSNHNVDSSLLCSVPNM